MQKNTMTDLVIELEKLEPTQLRTRLIKEAKEGGFHDYRSKSVCGKTFFLECAKWFKANISKVNSSADGDIGKIVKIETDIKEGVYDEPYTEEDSKIVLKEMKEDKSLSEQDRRFGLAAMAWKK